jgi:hypothetical protein
LIEGSASNRAVQYFRIVQQPAAFANLVTDLPIPSVDVEVLQVGGGGHNHKIRITIGAGVYEGFFTLIFQSTPEETNFISWNASAESLIATLGTTAAVGA